MANYFDQFDQPSGGKNFFDQFDEPKEKRDTGFTGSAKATLEDIKGQGALTLGKIGLMDKAEAEQYAAAQKAKSEKIFQPTQKGWTEASGEKIREMLGSTAAYAAAPLAAAGATALLPEFAVAGIGGATLAGLGVGTAQYTGTNLARQMETGKRLADTSLLNAGAAAVGESVLDRVSFGMMPGIRKIFTAAGKDLSEEAVKTIAKKGLLATAGEYALAGGKAAGTEGATEAAQAFLERLQAGLNISNAQARDEYFQNFIGGAILGGAVSGPGRFIEKSFAPKGAAPGQEPEEKAPKVSEIYPTAEPVTSAGLQPIVQPAPIAPEAPVAAPPSAPAPMPSPTAEVALVEAPVEAPAAPPMVPKSAIPSGQLDMATTVPTQEIPGQALDQHNFAFMDKGNIQSVYGNIVDKNGVPYIEYTTKSGNKGSRKFTNDVVVNPNPDQMDLLEAYHDKEKTERESDDFKKWLFKQKINTAEKADMGLDPRFLSPYISDNGKSIDELTADAISNGILNEKDLTEGVGGVESMREILHDVLVNGARAPSPENQAYEQRLAGAKGRIEAIESQLEPIPEEVDSELAQQKMAELEELPLQYSKATVEEKKAASDVAAHYKGDLVWQEGPLALVRDYGVQEKSTGQPLYRFVKNRSAANYRLEDMSPASLGITQEQKDRIVGIKNQIEKEAQEKHDQKPFLTIKQGVTGSPDLHKNILPIAKNWAKILGINANVYITTSEDALANRENYTGPHRIIGYMGGKDVPGVMTKIDDNNYAIVLRKTTSPSKMLETLAHEMGHIHEKNVFDQADPETKQAIIKDFNKWMSSLSKETLAKEMIHTNLPKTMAQTTEMPEGLKVKNVNNLQYWTKFAEWYANQVARWSVTSDKPVSVVEKFFKKLADAMRRFYQTAKGQKYLPTENMKQFLDNIASKVTFAEYAESKEPKGQMALFAKGKVEAAPSGKLSNAPPKTFTKITPQQTAGEKLQTINANVKNAWNDDKFWTKIRNEWIDPSSGLTKSLQSEETFKDGQLRADMLNHAQAQSINLIKNGLLTGMPVLNKDGSIVIDESENNLARSQTIADSIDNNSYVRSSGLSGRAYIAEIARAMRGKEIMEEDAARRKLGIQQLKQAKEAIKAAQEARDEKRPIGEIRNHLNRAKDLRKQGYENKSMNRELQVDQAQIDWAEKQLKNVPEVKQVLDIWKNVNDSLVKLWESVGLLTKDQADNYLSKKSYVPLFKSREDLSDKPTGFGGTGLKTAKELKRLKGADIDRNIWENVEKHYASMVASAYQNQTRKVGSEQLKSLGLAEVTDATNPDVNLRYRDPTSEFSDNQGIVHMIIENPNDLAAFQMMHYELGPIMKGMAAANNLLRAGALLNPMFWIKQLIRDPIHATLVTNSGIVTPFHSAKGYLDILRGDSREAGILARAGVIGQMDSTIDIHDFLKQVGQEKKTPSLLDKAIHKAMKFHEASDAATRVAIFKDQEKQALAKGMSKEDAVNYAVFKARESINFAIHGTSPIINNLRNMIPFLSASINSLDTVYRAATGYGLPPAEKKAAQMLFVKRAAMMSVMATAYAMMYQGDEDYKKLPDYTKDNNFLLPNPFGDGHTFIKIPVPFEVGFLFKTVPEATVRYMAGNSTGKEVLGSYLSGITNTIPGNGILLPQAVKPAFEVVTNHSFFTHRPIESIGEQNLPIAMRGARASEVSKQLSSLGLDKVGLSPAKIDYLIQGYAAELGTFTTGMASSAVDLATGQERTAKNIEEMPFFKSFMTNPKASKAIADFYDLTHTAQETVNEFNQYKKFGEVEKIKELMANEQNRKLIAAAPELRGIQSQMTNLRTQMKVIDQNQNMDPEVRRQRLNDLQTVYERLALQGEKIATAMKIER
jgi:hypothetical protein